ncbi:hypothetical protein [Evtepia sp.]|uniref:hypothetical protein n=1 Tax=Evtepia sp. TaxID=2773933 RepID=UPI00399B816F
MKVWTNETKRPDWEGGIAMMHGHHRPGHIPPHAHRALLRVEFDEQSWALWEQVFGDDDTVGAAAEILRNAPPEIQILAVQLIAALGQGAPAGGAADEEEARSTACPRFPSPVLGEEARALYARLYGGNGRRFADILDTSPDEIAVVSRLIAYLAQREEG